MNYVGAGEGKNQKDRRAKSFHVDTETEAVRHPLPPGIRFPAFGYYLYTSMFHSLLLSRSAWNGTSKPSPQFQCILLMKLRCKCLALTSKCSIPNGRNKISIPIGWKSGTDCYSWSEEAKISTTIGNETEANKSWVKAPALGDFERCYPSYEENKTPVRLHCFTNYQIQNGLNNSHSRCWLFEVCLFKAEHLTKYEVEKAAEDLQPPLERRKHKRVPISPRSLYRNSRCTRDSITEGVSRTSPGKSSSACSRWIYSLPTEINPCVSLLR